VFKTIFFIVFIAGLVYSSTQKQLFQQDRKNPFTLNTLDDSHNQAIFDSFKRIETKRIQDELEEEQKEESARVARLRLIKQIQIDAEKLRFIAKKKRLIYEKEQKRRLSLIKEKALRTSVSKRIIALKKNSEKKALLLDKKQNDILKNPTFNSITAHIDLSDQRINVYKGKTLLHRWKVSTARRGYITPVGAYKPLYMQKMHYSKKYHNSPMPYSIFFKGGYAIHGTGSLRRLGRIASHGCVRLHPKHAKSLYALVKQYGKENTTITITP
jgi:lipoprotein-anchoring transpeptidase ErfK/SrfK